VKKKKAISVEFVLLLGAFFVPVTMLLGATLVEALVRFVVSVSGVICGYWVADGIRSIWHDLWDGGRGIGK